MGMRGERLRERETCERNMIETGDFGEVLHAVSDIGNDQPYHMILIRRWPETGNPNSCPTQL